jgi:hypothetical protein
VTSVISSITLVVLVVTLALKKTYQGLQCRCNMWMSSSYGGGVVSLQVVVIVVVVVVIASHWQYIYVKEKTL